MAKPPKITVGPMKTAENVRAEMGRIYNQAINGEMEWSEAIKAVNCLERILKAIESQNPGAENSIPINFRINLGEPPP